MATGSAMATDVVGSRVGELADLPLERIEHEMLSLAGHLAAAKCSFLLMVGEFDARQGWATWESYSCAHWLNWRCGVGLTAAREQVRVARALRELPVVVDTFARGAVSYSKVRAITRVAHRGNEAALIDLARHSTAAQLERAVAGLRRVAEADSIREDEHASQRLRSLQWATELNGDLTLRARIPAGEAADAFRAQIAARLVTEPADGEQLEELDARRLDALLDAVSAGASVDATTASQPEVIVHLHLDVPDVPAEGAAWTLPDPIAPGLPESPCGSTGSPPEVAALASVLRSSMWPFITSTGTHLSTRRARALISDAGVRVVAELLDRRTDETSTIDLGTHDRFPNRALRRAVMRRDGGCCRFPGCQRRFRLHAHHIVWWEHGGLTTLDNLLMLCPKHHHAIHDRHWTLTGTAADHQFRRPDGHTVDPTAALLSGTTAELIEQHHRHGLDIAADGAGSHWTGDPLDWHSFYAAFANGPAANDPTTEGTHDHDQRPDAPLPHGSCGSGTLSPAAGTPRRGPH